MRLNTNKAVLEACCGKTDQFKDFPLPHIVLSGRSNVGKSSLINTLLGRKGFARVSSEPGKTVTVNFYNIDSAIYLVDLPGYGYARRTGSERERLGTIGEGYFKKYSPALVLQLVDMKVGATADDEAMINFLNEKMIPYVVVATKCDKLNKTMTELAYGKIPVERESVIRFSSLTGEGKDEVWETIFEAAELN